jgi:uncharacterized OB-fold protein
MSAIDKPKADQPLTDRPLPEKPLPDLSDPVTAPFWAATREGRLTVPRCTACGYRLWPPEPVCPECWHSEFVWEEVEPRGTLWSYATYRRALDPAFAADLPYVVGLVELTCGLKMYGIMRGEPGDMVIGRPVTAVFEPVNDEVTFVRWQLA